jgi:hypothetical protein
VSSTSILIVSCLMCWMHCRISSVHWSIFSIPCLWYLPLPLTWPRYSSSTVAVSGKTILPVWWWNISWNCTRTIMDPHQGMQCGPLSTIRLIGGTMDVCYPSYNTQTSINWLMNIGSSWRNRL